MATLSKVQLSENEHKYFLEINKEEADLLIPLIELKSREYNIDGTKLLTLSLLRDNLLKVGR